MLTLEQINQIRAKSGLPPKAGTQQNFVGKYDYLKPEKGFIDTVKESAATRLGDAKKALSGDVNPASAGLQFWGAGAGLVNDVIGAGIEKVAPGVTEKIGEVAGKVMATEPAQNAIASYQDFKSKYPEAAKDLESATNILSLLPTGKVFQVGSKSVKAGAEIAEQGIRNTLVGTGKVVEKSGEKLFKSSIPLSKAEAGIVQSYKAQNPLLKRLFDPIRKQPRTAAVTALDKGFTGTEQQLGILAKREAANLWKNRIAPAVRTITEKYDVQGAIKNLENNIKKIADPSRRASLMDAYKALKNDYKGFSKISYEKAQQIKADMAKFLPDKAFKGKPIGSAFKELQNMLIKDIREKTYAMLKSEGIKLDYLDYGNLLKLQEFGKIAMTGAKRKGGFGSFVSTLYDAATAPAKTYGGQLLYKGGQALQKLKK